MLRIESLSCGYGDMLALENLDVSVEKGQTLALLGANGAGKTSAIMSICGHVRIFGGKIVYKNDDITRMHPVQRVRNGIAVVPEGRRLFPRLSVKENLIVGGYVRPQSETRISMERVIGHFPRLGERLDQAAGSLSGGEQQMLAIGRALMAQPELLLVDELSLGLMPKMVDICYEVIETLKKEGMTIVLVEQRTDIVLDVADEIRVLESGKMVWEGSANVARSDPDVIDSLLGIRKNEQFSMPEPP